MAKKTIKNCFQNFRLSSQDKPGKSNYKRTADLAELQRLPTPSFEALVQIFLNKKYFRFLAHFRVRLESMTEFLRDLITTRFKDRIPFRGRTIIQYKYRHHPLCSSDRFGPSMAKKTIKNCFQNFRLSSQNKPDNSNNNWPTDLTELQRPRYLHFKPEFEYFWTKNISDSWLTSIDDWILTWPNNDAIQRQNPT